MFIQMRKPRVIGQWSHGGEMVSGLGPVAPAPTLPATQLSCLSATNYIHMSLGQGPCESVDSRLDPGTSGPWLPGPMWLRGCDLTAG